MDNSAQIEQPVPELSPGAFRPPERRGIRRRLVQSTLFPHKPPDREEKGDTKGERDCDREENGENDECCGSRKKRKTKAERKATPSEKAPKKVRERRLSDSPNKTTPKKTTPKKNTAKKTTPKKNTPKKKLTYTNSEDAAPVIPDLRLEAKLTAEENSRMFAGKQIHPFFSYSKSGNKNGEVTDVDGSRFPVGKKGKKITCGPIHVYERIQEDDVSLNWGTWNFYEEAFGKRICGPESMCSSVFEGSVKCLSFDKLPFVSYSSTLSNFQNETSSEHCSVQEECQSETILIDSDVSDDEQLICYQPLKEADESEVNKVDSFCGHTGCERKSDIEQQSRFLDERMKSYYFVCGNQPGNRLWTSKYQPKKAVEVCGNDESVKFLNEWLRLCHVRGFRISKDHTASHSHEMQDKDYSYENDSDSEGKNEEASMKNVLLITGPVGSGKSAAIYACAQEQGFEVLEVNASRCRNGALLKQEFSEDSGLYRYERPLSNPAGSQNKHVAKSPSAFANGLTPQEFDEEVVELIPSIDESLHNVIGGSENSDRKEGRSSCRQREVKTLLLFEDVDINFVEDHGFITAVKQIAETANRPIILTSNCPNPLLPDSLDRLQVSFSLPSSKELLCHVYMVCATERVKVQPHLLERLIGFCQGDIRKIFMQLQFWCQGRRSRKARKMEKTYGSLHFDLEAGHQMLPKLIPWDLPSRLSELVDKEITESLCRKENTLMEVVEEQYLDNKEVRYRLDIHNNEAESIEAKKVEMLSRNGSVHDYDDFTAQFDMCSDFCDNSDTPFSCKRNVRRKHDVVLSSDSEDEFFKNKNIKVSDKRIDNEALFDVKLPCSEEANIDGKHYECSETADLHLTNTYRSANISCVPELSFVPETEINDGTELQSGAVSCGQVVDTVEGVSVSDWLPVETISFVISEPGIDESSDTLVSTHHEVGELCHQEKVEDSQNELVEVVASEYQVMDEFSRMGSNTGSKFMKRSLVATDLVQKSWNKLRSYHTDLRQYAESELQHASQIVQLTCSMTDLISDTDLLLSNCQLLTTDSLEPSMIPPEKSDAYSSYDEQLPLASTIAQHGFCSYTKDIFAVGSTMGYESTVDLASEMLGSATDMIAWGKLVGEHPRSRSSCTGRNSEFSLPKNDISFKSETKSCLFDIVQSIVPSKSYMTLKGVAFNEYLSSLRNISRFEASRLSDNIDNTRRRRRRVARHYLSSGKLMLSPEEISMLGQFNLYDELHSQ